MDEWTVYLLLVSGTVNRRRLGGANLEYLTIGLGLATQGTSQIVLF